ncbi:zinc metalloproteinase-disintegrin-like atragin [Erythrolamprus reginae]|uniref:zinc metalloproteinase-disintegrin-like atragin n=1 Tax=Erythrolamprus reginae TaxID=121349 RepID=UPI00396C4AE0
MIQALLVTIYLAVFPYQGSSIILESGNVNDYELVYPQKVPSLPKGGFQKAEPETEYEDKMKYEFHVNGEPVVLHLERNKGLFAEGYSETHYSPDGREITTSPPVQDHCYYHGHIQDEAHSTAVISACNGLKGHFKHEGETYFIEPLKHSNSEAHAIYKYESLEKENETPKTCGVTQTTWESDKPIEKSLQSGLTPEQLRYLQDPKFVEFVVVVDNRMFRKYSEDVTAIRTKVYQMVNAVNGMYRDLDVYIALIGLEIWSDKDKINVQSDVDATLDLFGAWREKDLLPRRSHDNAQLLTGIDFNGQTVGLGYMDSFCRSKYSSAVVQDHSEGAIFVAATMAHEMGHNLGIGHDKTSCTCQPNSCVMTASLGFSPPYEFSSCSLEQHQQYLIKDHPQCILNKPLITDIVAPAVCGNYFLEEGEDCDCGSPENCQSTCCNATTCKLQPTAKCDSGECCEQCNFKGAGVECRGVKDDCDLAESCTGQSGECPTDQFQRDGQPCQNNEGYCYNGKCPTLASQCIDIFGPGNNVGRDGCFQINLFGTDFGYCRRENGVKSPCKPQDIKCGRLYCTEENKKLCQMRYLPNTPDDGMVEPGTKCGDGKVCSNRECVDVKTAY